MPDHAPFPQINGPIVTAVTFVDRIRRQSTGDFQSRSLPGHLIHVCIAGEVEQFVGGLQRNFGRGSAVWYFEDESVWGKVLQAPWEFYTINFTAPSLPPPPLSERVVPVQADTTARVEKLFEAWRELDAPPLQRHLTVYGLLLEIINDIYTYDSQHHRIDGPAQVWWEVEAIIRERLDEPVDLTRIVELSGSSERSISRACQLATGMSPIKRVKEIRLNYARGLTQFSSCSMTEIAYRVGYTRVQEFSRDYRKYFGMTPTQDRKAGGDYHKQ